MYLWLRRANDGYSPLPMLWILAHQHKVKKSTGNIFQIGVETCSQKLALVFLPLGPADLQSHCVCSTEQGFQLRSDSWRSGHQSFVCQEILQLFENRSQNIKVNRQSIGCAGTTLVLYVKQNVQKFLNNPKTMVRYFSLIFFSLCYFFLIRSKRLLKGAFGNVLRLKSRLRKLFHF